jgi:hypothetical protein
MATITGTKPAVSVEDVADALYALFQLKEGDFSVHLHHPEDFLIIFATKQLKDHVNGDHFICRPTFVLSLRPWCKLAHANAGRFEHRVELELRGIPADAWHVLTAEHLLGSGCWVEHLHPGTSSCADLTTFRLTARTHDPTTIRRRAVLEIVEVIPRRRPRDAANIRPLLYNISIHATRSELINATPAYDDPSGHGGADGNPNAGRRNHNGRGQGRRGGRKRRRMELAPEGRADGMAMDSFGWASARPGRSDGVLVGTFWCSAIAAAAAPPAVPPLPARVMDP